jgi:hypothetical protein
MLLWKYKQTEREFTVQVDRHLKLGNTSQTTFHHSYAKPKISTMYQGSGSDVYSIPGILVSSWFIILSTLNKVQLSTPFHQDMGGGPRPPGGGGVGWGGGGGCVWVRLCV